MKGHRGKEPWPGPALPSNGMSTCVSCETRVCASCRKDFWGSLELREEEHIHQGSNYLSFHFPWKFLS